MQLSDMPRDQKETKCHIIFCVHSKGFYWLFGTLYGEEVRISGKYSFSIKWMPILWKEFGKQMKDQRDQCG